MKKLLMFIAFSIAAPVLLMFSSLYLASSIYSQTLHPIAISKAHVAYAALPPAQNVMADSITKQDGRVKILQNFFSEYHSPLLPYASDIIRTAGHYGIDYRLLPAIAMQESNLCKKAPKESYNCWGFGIYGKTMTTFSNYPQAINIITKTLAQNYKANGLITPYQIMSKYTPSNNGTWANSVSLFMNELL